MESLYLLIPLSIVLVFGIGVTFWWSVRNGQFDDLEGPAYRILMDDEPSPRKPQEIRADEGAEDGGK
ncbi:cytochrome oxidase maturation protein, cbb3-type [Azospira sp. I13]|uniref:cbb3-type cytochrome oxidase assembly protein CcoS n=1 Tax=Azospira sp. I13 TaxID=1765050 RepID=UPI000D4D5D16|nr:cbb3-type cytochrome oxidase assembly protein CcoS [Azospira sp. I13]GBG00946.1 cytochrome oxidase maturation protein, cbb3-type [Azospira sp. I13]